MRRSEEACAEAVLLDFLELVLADRAAGVQRGLSDYAARFPGHEALVRAELARLDSAREASAPGGPINAGPGELPALIAHLARKRDGSERYLRGEEIGRGATSRVYLARDLELEREVAMKVHAAPLRTVLRRFVREARVIGRLDHPGIVAVHDLGLDHEDRVYFTMRLIRGQSLKDLLQEPAGDAGHRRRFLDAVVHVCDTLAFAHARGVVHRDVKPSNVMLGRFGEVYLVDWGLARLRDERLEPDPATPVPGPGETLAGQVLGTPAYMAPEQARGEPRAVGPHSDVYAVGSILHHYLAGRAPYCEGDNSPSTEEVLRRLVSGAAPRLPSDVRAREPELASIAGRAMARDAEQRYPGAAEMAADLRAYLDGHAVRAHRGGFLYRGTKWVRRNRALAAGLLAVLLLGLVSLRATREARARNADLRFLADLRGPLDLMDEFDSLWPASPEHAAAIADWIRRAEGLRAREGVYARELERLRRTQPRLPVPAHTQDAYERRRQERLHAAERAIAGTQGLLQGRERGELEGPPVATLRNNLASLERARKAFQAWPAELESRDFTEAETQLLYDRLEQFLAELDFVLGRTAPSERLLLARAALAVAELVPEAGSFSWQEASVALRADPRFGGLELVPQRGLVPLGPDPVSGLWEFAHPQSGRVPRRGTDGRLSIGVDDALVLVLVPGGACEAGAQANDPTGSLYDPHAERRDGPLLALELAPFFLSKYELTLAQWCRMTGSSHETYTDSMGADGKRLDFPVYWTTGEWAGRVLAAYGLELPTSVAWEHAARAGTRSIWWCGDDLASLEGCGNVADFAWRRASGARDADVAGAVPFSDGYHWLAPIASFRPNAYGLHDTIGNVAEWCRDLTMPYHHAFIADTGELAPRYAWGMQIVRGGYHEQGAYACRSAAREYVPPTTSPGYVGIRPSRRVEP